MSTSLWVRLLLRLLDVSPIDLSGEASDGGWPWPQEPRARKAIKRALRLRDALQVQIRVPWDGSTVRFLCQNRTEVWRAATALSKEPGTVRWLADTLGPGDVFYDVGANIGVFTLLAATRVGPRGRVVAFEPHCGNFARLMGNVSLNRLSGTVIPCGAAVGHRDGFLGFDYASPESGSSGSQLGGDLVLEGRSAGFPQELKSEVTLDALIEIARLPSPTHVKIDVDGLEEDVLLGMDKTLSGKRAPVWLQVEIAPGREAAVRGRLEKVGYAVHATHRSFCAAEVEGAQEGSEPYNALFRRIRPN